METCRWCGRELRDVTDPSFGPPPPKRWVHDAGGHSICYPAVAGSPRAAPGDEEGPTREATDNYCREFSHQRRIGSVLYDMRCHLFGGHVGQHGDGFAVMAKEQR